jgi:hypothetical protein
MQNSKFADVNEFYSQLALARDPRIVANAKRKKRQDLMPSYEDRMLLAEAATLALTDNAAIMTNDSDFTSFVSEIQQSFAVTIIDLNTLPVDYAVIYRILDALSRS